MIEIDISIPNYISLEYANKRLNRDFKISDNWKSLTDEKKDDLIFTACDYIDTKVDWIGTKWYFEQDREFPRNLSEFFRWNYRYKKYNGRIPDEIKRAVVELIRFWISVENFSNFENLKEFGIKSMTTPETVKIEFNANASSGAANKFDLPIAVKNLTKLYSLDFFPKRITRGGNISSPVLQAGLDEVSII